MESAIYTTIRCKKEFYKIGPGGQSETFYTFGQIYKVLTRKIFLEKFRDNNWSSFQPVTKRYVFPSHHQQGYSHPSLNIALCLLQSIVHLRSCTKKMLFKQGSVLHRIVIPTFNLLVHYTSKTLLRVLQNTALGYKCKSVSR